VNSKTSSGYSTHTTLLRDPHLFHKIFEDIFKTIICKFFSIGRL